MPISSLLDSARDVYEGGFRGLKAAYSLPLAAAGDIARNAILVPEKATYGLVSKMTGLQPPKTPDFGMQKTEQAGEAFYEPGQQMKRGVQNILINTLGFKPEGYGRGVAKMLSRTGSDFGVQPASGTTTVSSPSVRQPVAAVPAVTVTGGYGGREVGAPSRQSSSSYFQERDPNTGAVIRRVDLPETPANNGQLSTPANPYDERVLRTIDQAIKAIIGGANNSGTTAHERYLQARSPKALGAIAQIIAPMSSQGQYGLETGRSNETARHNLATEDLTSRLNDAQIARYNLEGDIMREKLPAEIGRINSEAARNYAGAQNDIYNRRTVGQDLAKEEYVANLKAINDPLTGKEARTSLIEANKQLRAQIAGEGQVRPPEGFQPTGRSSRGKPVYYNDKTKQYWTP